MRLRLLTFFFLPALLLEISCERREIPRGEIYYAVTVQPLRMILGELTAGRAEVIALLPPGASPHTYEPRPSDLKITQGAKHFFHVSSLIDAWAAGLPSAGDTEIMNLMPAVNRRAFPEGVEEDEKAGGAVIDPHFWTDPMTVAALLPPLTDRLCEIDPAGTETYRANEEKFDTRLRALDREFASTLKPLNGRSVFLFHPSFLYLMNRYHLLYAGSIEGIPGKEASPGYLIAVIKAVRAKDVPAIFTEPQLARRPAEIIAESASVPLLQLDPNGGVPGRMTYEELMRYNVATLRRPFAK